MNHKYSLYIVNVVNDYSLVFNVVSISSVKLIFTVGHISIMAALLKGRCNCNTV